MPRKNRNKQYTKLLPDFSFASKYVYFKDLLEDSSVTPYYSHFAKEKRKLGYTAMNELNKAGMDNFHYRNGDNKQIMSAIQFLKQVADSERTKEKLAIEDYKKQLRECIPTMFSNSKELRKTLDRLESLDLNNLNNTDDFYITLTKSINYIRQNGDEYINRLQQLIEHNDIKEKGFGPLADQQYLYRLYGDIEGLFKNIEGIQERTDAGTISSKIRNYAIEYAKKKKILRNEDILGGDFLAIIAAIMADLEHFVQLEYYKTKDSNKDNKITDEIVDKAWEAYLRADNEEKTRFQTALVESADELQDITENFKTALGIRKLTGEELIKSETKQARQQALYQSTDKKTRGSAARRNKIHRDFKNIKLNGRTRADDLNAWTWSTRTDQSHGNLNEAVLSIVSNAFLSKKVQGSAGTDLISLGQIIGSINDKELKNITSKKIDNLRQSITDYYTHLQREDRNDSKQDAFENMNKTIRGQIKELEEELNKINNLPDNIFIYHESLKLYASVELGNNNIFHGRSLNILNAFDEIYSMAGAETLILPHKDIIEGICINLSELALGHNLKGLIEDYLSIFAGMLMFDDLQNIAFEATNQLTQGKVRQVHLYNINGIYLPSSYILTKVYESLMESVGYLNSGKAAQVSISTNGADTVINQYLQNRFWGGNNYTARYPEIWNETANEVIKGIDINITFLISFIDFLKDLGQ